MKASTLDIQLTHLSLANLALFLVLQHFQKKAKGKKKPYTKPETSPIRHQGSRAGEAAREALQFLAGTGHPKVTQVAWQGLGRSTPSSGWKGSQTAAGPTWALCSPAPGSGFADKGRTLLRGRKWHCPPRASMLCFPAINLSQLHKSANINCWWELCKHNTCNGEFRGSLPFVHLLVVLVCFF